MVSISSTTFSWECSSSRRGGLSQLSITQFCTFFSYFSTRFRLCTWFMQMIDLSLIKDLLVTTPCMEKRNHSSYKSHKLDFWKIVSFQGPHDVPFWRLKYFSWSTFSKSTWQNVWKKSKFNFLHRSIHYVRSRSDLKVIWPAIFIEAQKICWIWSVLWSLSTSCSNHSHSTKLSISYRHFNRASIP